MADTASCGVCRTLLSQGLDLCVRAKKLDADVNKARGIGKGCATPALWVLDQYDRDLQAWEDRSRKHLMQGCFSG